MLSEKPWTQTPTSRLFVAIFLAIFMLIGVAGLAPASSGKKPEPSANKVEENSSLTTMVGTLVPDGSILVMVAWLLLWQRIGWSDAFGLRHRPAYAVGLGILVGLAFFPLGLSLETLVQYALEHMFRVDTHEQQAVEILRHAEPGWIRVYLAFFAVGIAPVAEESVFRGVIYPTIKQSGFPRVALWGTSLLFALIHTNLMAFVPLTILAFVLTWLYEKTDNLLANITAHATFNAINLVLLYIREHVQNSPS